LIPIFRRVFLVNFNDDRIASHKVSESTKTVTHACYRRQGGFAGNKLDLVGKKKKKKKKKLILIIIKNIDIGT